MANAFSSSSSATAPGDPNNGTWTRSNNNLTTSRTPGGVTNTNTAVTGILSLKIYWETPIAALGNDNISGIIKSGDSITAFLGSTANAYGYSSLGHIYNNGGNTAATVATLANGDIAGHAFDGANYWVSKNGTWQNSATIAEVAAGTTTHAIATGLAGTWYPAVAVGSSSGTAVTWSANFGTQMMNFPIPSGFSTFDTLLGGSRMLLMGVG